ncbi:MAG: MSMEG_6728 family protein [Amnibacterium sp.]
MQTFLPYPSFAASAASLDGPRLGKQRVETLQILRALLVPTYGWQRHPVVQMWRGHVPALTAYGLAMTDEWLTRGHADTVRPQLVEFAPEVDGVPQEALAARGLLPPWLGDEAVHESHRSRLIQKDPAFYEAVFPGTRPDLDYVWPPPPAEPPPAPQDPLWVVRVDDAATWRDAGLVGIPAVNPAGKVTRAWAQQLDRFTDALEPGTRLAVLGADPALLHLAEITGPPASVTIDGADFLARAARYEGDLARGELPVPAELQNPRRLFPVAPPRAVPRLVDDGEP